MKPKKTRLTKLKNCKEGFMPNDFWNYNVHPITGFAFSSKNYYYINKKS